MGERTDRSPSSLSSRLEVAWGLGWKKRWPYQRTYFSNLHEILFAASLQIGRCRRKGLGEWSKALRRPHVLATTQLVRGPLGKEREAKGFVGCREPADAPQQKA